MFAQNLNFQVFKRVKNMLRRHSPIFELLAFMPFSGFWAPRSKRSLPDMLSTKSKRTGESKEQLTERHENAVRLSCHLMLRFFFLYKLVVILFDTDTVLLCSDEKRNKVAVLWLQKQPELGGALKRFLISVARAFLTK
jgi:hypothetical protein